MFRVFAKLTLLLMFTSFFAAQAQALFLQPDWLEVTKKGVGTNRYAYSFNDPVNKKDPSGNKIELPDDEDQKAQVEAAIEVVKNSSKKNAAMIKDLEETEKVIQIKTTTAKSQVTANDWEKVEKGVPTGSLVEWDPLDTESQSQTDKNGNKRSTPEATLGHELAHAHDMATGNVDLSDTNHPVTPSHERNAVKAQNDVLASQGKPSRDGYYDWERTTWDKVRALWGDYEVK